MDCKNCFRIWEPVADCINTLLVATNEPDADLIITITDKFDNIYINEITSESSGIVVLDLADEDIYPEQLINPYAGQFKLTISKDGEILPFVVNNINYDCLIFECKTTFPKETTYTIDVYGNETGGY